MSKNKRNDTIENDEVDFNDDNIQKEFSRILDREALRLWKLYIQSVNQYRSTIPKVDIIKTKLGVTVSTINKIQKQYKLQSPYRNKKNKKKSKKNEEGTSSENKEKERGRKSKNKKTQNKEDITNISGGDPELPETKNKTKDEQIEELQYQIKQLQKLIEERQKPEERLKAKLDLNPGSKTPEQLRKQYDPSIKQSAEDLVNEICKSKA